MTRRGDRARAQHDEDALRLRAHVIPGGRARQDHPRGAGRWRSPAEGREGRGADADHDHGRAEKVGMEVFTLHDLRHLFASGLIAAGCDVVTVQHALGHSQPTITLNTYSHLWLKAEDRTRAAAASLWRSADSLGTMSTGDGDDLHGHR